MASCASALSAAISGQAAQCAAVAEFSFDAITEAPTARQIARICSSPQCSKVLAAIRQAVPSECSLATGDKTIQLYQDVLNPITAACSKGSIVATRAPSPAANNQTEAEKETAGSSSQAASVTGTTKEPETVTAAPQNVTATTKAPVPAPASAAAGTPTRSLVRTIAVVVVGALAVLQVS